MTTILTGSMKGHSTQRKNAGGLLRAGFCGSAMMLGFLLSTAIPARAQMDADFSLGGAARVGWSTTTCNAAAEGAIRYNSGSGGSIDYCNGVSWANVSAGGGGANLNNLSDARTDYVGDFNLLIGTPADAWAIAAGGQHNLTLGQLAGDSITTGDRNLAIGYNALTGTTTAADNLAIGYHALRTNSIGAGNVAVGMAALELATGGFNIAVGKSAGSLLTTGSANTLIGDGAAFQITGNSASNVVVGSDAGGIWSGGAKTYDTSTIIGAQAGSANDGDNNVFLGYQAGDNVTTGASNIIVGSAVDAMSATANNQLNIGDTIYGDLANDRMRLGGTGAVSAFSDLELAGTLALKLSSGTTAQRPGTPANGMIRYNSQTGKFEGYQAGVWVDMIAAAGTVAIDDLTDAETDYATDFNLFMGSNAGVGVVAGAQYNLAIGQNALDAVLTNAADNNTAIGHNTLTANTSGNNNIAIGRSALDANTTGPENIAIGVDAMGLNSTGQGNIAMGVNSLGSITTGMNWMVAIGHRSLEDNTTGADNVGLGSGTLANNTIGSNNVAIGFNALNLGLDANNNVAIGKNALNANTGDYNMAFGFQALDVNTSGSYNTAIGNDALGANLTSNSSTGIGYEALILSTGAGNTAIGYQAGGTITTGADNIAIGSGVNVASATASNQLNIGNLITGVTNTGLMQINGTGALTLPIGQTSTRPAGVNGMIRYNSQTGKFEGYQAGTWVDMIGSGTTALSAISAATGINSINNLNNAQTWSWNTLTTESAMTLGSTSVTSGKVLFVSSGATAMTGTLADIVLSGNNAANTGTVLKASVTGATSAAVPLMVTNLGTGLSFRVNDQTGDADTTPFVIDAAGNVGINSATPAVGLDILTTDAAILPRGNTAQRPAAVNGMIRYNSQTGKFEGYQAGTWIDMIASAGTVAIDDLTDAETDYATDFNLFMGSNAGVGVVGGAQFNVAIGQNSLDAVLTNAADGNTAVGHDTLTANTSGASNTALGRSALGSNTTGSFNVALGKGTLQLNTIGIDNIAIGDDAMVNNVRGDANVGIGANALVSNVAREQSVAVGYDAMRYADSTATADQISYNTAVGYQALMGSATPASNTGVSNTAIGHSALKGNTSGNNNTAVGEGALLANTTGANSTAVGEGALYQATTASNNIAIGYLAMQGVTTSVQDNLAIGNNALRTISNSGYSNVAIGNSALYSTTSGTSVGVGVEALRLATGATNIGLGFQAGDNITTGASNIIIGSVDAPSATASNQLNIGGLITGTMNTGLMQVNGTGALTLPIGQTGTRPTGVNGMIRYNSQTGKFEGYQAGTWIDMIASGTVSFPLVANPSGTAAAPSYSFVGYTSTGMFSDTANTIEFTANGVQVLQLGTTASGTSYFEMVPGAAGVAPILRNVTSATGGTALGLTLTASSATALGTGGPISITAGAGNTLAGGDVTITAGANSGGASMTGGAGSGGSAGGNANVIGGAGNGAGAGGNANLGAGAGGATGAGGGVSITGGSGGGTSGNAGGVTIAGGTAYTGAGGSIAITGSGATGGNNNGGNVTLTAGTETGSGTSGIVDIASGLRISNDVTSASLGASQNDYVPTNGGRAAVYRLTASTPINITGLAGGSDGRILTLMNVGTNAITLVDESVSSTAANRLALTGNLSLAADQSTVMIYDSTSQRWRIFGADGLSGSGTAANPTSSVQFNSGGAFTGSANFTYNTTDGLIVGIGTAPSYIDASLTVYDNASGNTLRWGPTHVNSATIAGYLGFTGTSDIWLEANNANFLLEVGAYAGSTPNYEVLTGYNSGNAVSSAIRYRRYNNNGAGANNIGSAIDTYLEATTGGDNGVLSSRVQTVATNAVAANMTTRVDTIPYYNAAAAGALTVLGTSGGSLVGINNTAPAVGLDILTTDAAILPRGTTAQRPAAVNGMIRYNSQTGKFEGYQAGAWVDMIASAGAVSIDSLTDAKTDYVTDHNLWMGNNAGNGILSGGLQNTVVGEDAGDGITTGDYNVGLGYQSLTSATTGISNTALGTEALYAVSTTSHNTAVGASSMHNVTGTENTAVGSRSMFPVSSGTSYSTAIGVDTLANATGWNNVAVGYRAGDNITSGGTNIIIGYDVDAPSATASNQLNIGGLITGTMNTGLMQVNGTGALTLPIGQTGTRPTGVNGMIRYNSQTGKFEGYQAGLWVDMIASGTVTFPLVANTAGTAAAPAYSFVGFTSTGMFSDTANTVEFTANGVQVLQLSTAASGINYFEMVPGASGVAPILRNVSGATNGVGLGLTLTAGTASAAGIGGPLTLTAGGGNGALGGGTVDITGGIGGATGAGGAVTITSGAGQGGNNGGTLTLAGGVGQGAGQGGAISVAAGTGGATGIGASVSMRGGHGGATSGNAGGVGITGGTPVDGNGGALTLSGSNGVGTNRSGGNVTLTAGTETGTGTPGIVDIASGLRISNDVTSASLGASQNDYVPTNGARAAVYRLTASTPISLTGLAGGSDGRILTLMNVGANAITLTDEDVASALANRFALTQNLTLAPDQSTVLIYDATSTKWRVFGADGLGGAASNFAAGLVGTPGFYVTGDTNTGFWQSGLDTLNIAAGGVEVMRWNTTGTGVNYFSVTPGATGVAPSITNGGTDTNGAGLGLTFTGKAATAAGVGGPITMTAGTGNGANLGGALNLTGGAGGATGGGGAVSITAGNATGGNTNGGNVTLTPGNEAGSGTSGIVFVSGGLALGADVTSTSLGSSQNDYVPTNGGRAGVWRLTASTPINLTGLAGGSDGRVLTLMNVGANAITLVDESVSSAAANRLALTNNLSLAQDQSTVLIYDATSTRWRVFGADGLSGGGGVAGSNTQIQFNSGGAFGAASGLTWTVGTTTLGVTGKINVSDRVSITGQTGNAPNVLALSQLSGVSIASPVTTDLLTYNGTNWVRSTAVTTAVTVPSGTVAQRPGTPTAGMVRYCTSGGTCAGGANGFEVYKAAWTDMGAAASSDIRLKTSIVKLDSGDVLDKLQQVQGYSFEYKDALGATHYGVMAQEFEKIFPELVYSPPNDGMKSVRYLETTALLIEAAKALKSENDTLKTKVSTLEERMASIEGDMNGMKAYTGYGINKASIGLGMLAGALGMIAMVMGFFFIRNRRRETA